jgi:hypothetical protein
MAFPQLLGLLTTKREDDSHWGWSMKILRDLRTASEAEPGSFFRSWSGRYVTGWKASDRALLWSGEARLLGYCDCRLLCGAHKVWSYNKSYIVLLSLLLPKPLPLLWFVLEDTVYVSVDCLCTVMKLWVPWKARITWLTKPVSSFQSVCSVQSVITTAKISQWGRKTGLDSQ